MFSHADLAVSGQTPCPPSKRTLEQLIASADALRYENANNWYHLPAPFWRSKNTSPAMYTENTALRVTMEKRGLCICALYGQHLSSWQMGWTAPANGDYTGIFLCAV